MGNRQARRCLYEDDWSGNDESSSHCRDHRHEDEKYDSESMIPIDDGFLHEGSRRGLIPNESLQQYVDQVYKTYPADEIMRLAIDSVPKLPTLVNSTIAALANICLSGLANQHMNEDNLDLALSRIKDEVSRDSTSAAQALVAIIDVGLAMLRYPGAHNELDGCGAWVDLEWALHHDPITCTDPATEKRLAWLEDAMKKVGDRITVMESWDD